MRGRDGVLPSMYEAWAVLRVRQWFVFAPLPAAGVVHLDELQGARLLHVMAAMVVSGLSLAYAYGLNAIFDRRSDADPHKNVLAGRDRVPMPAILSVIAAGLLALVGASALGQVALFSIALSIAGGTVYSAGPRLKRFPVIGLLGNLMIFAPLMAPAMRPETTPVGFPALLTVFALLVTQNQLMHEEGDAAEDAAAGAWTTARWLGPRGTRTTSWALGLGIAGAGALAPTRLGWVVCSLAAAASILIATYIEPAKTRRKAHRYLSAMIGVALFFVFTASYR